MMPRPHRTPISRIPPEILAEILLLCAPLRYHIVSERSSILFPSQVSHHWRSTALSTPALWTFILFLCRQEEYFSREAECARVWLSRSSQCPLSIEVVSRTNQARTEAALQILIPHCTRWKTIITGSLNLDPCIWLPVAGKLPSLESADLYYGSGEAFAIAPRLQHLRLQFEEPLLFEPVKLPWTQLAHLELIILDGHVMSHVLETLQQASNIATLQIYSSSSWHIPERNSSTILTHPNISTLEIFSGNEVSNKSFLDGLALPALRILSLSKQWRCATSLLSRSACNLSSLNTHLDNSFDISELVQLPLNNSLSHWRVRFEGVEKWETLVESLTLPRNMPPFNNLRSLEMHLFFTPSRPIDMDIFADMVASRWRRVDAGLDPESARCATLSHVEMCVNQDISKHHAAISRLRTFAAEGLDIKVCSYHERYV